MAQIPKPNPKPPEPQQAKPTVPGSRRCLVKATAQYRGGGLVEPGQIVDWPVNEKLPTWLVEIEEKPTDSVSD